jgi:putative transposase
MARRSPKPEEIVTKLRRVDVLHGQGKTMAEAMRQIA